MRALTAAFSIDFSTHNLLREIVLYFQIVYYMQWVVTPSSRCSCPMSVVHHVEGGFDDDADQDDDGTGC